MSDDGNFGITVIAFIGSVFSPYYARARRRGATDPLNHCSINVALYTPRGGRWCMTERGAGRVHSSATALSIGPSSVRWTGTALEVLVDEICAPLPRRLRGSITLYPAAVFDRDFDLDLAGRHRWSPIAPCGRIEVRMSHPSLQWSGLGYLDSNSGSEPLEDRFENWTWSRSESPHGTVVFYDVAGHALRPDPLALSFATGHITAIEPPPRRSLPRTAWGLQRDTRAGATDEVKVQRTLEDAPFYSRSLLASRARGVRTRMVHESLDLTRFRSPWVQCLLPFRMPRIGF